MLSLHAQLILMMKDLKEFIISFVGLKEAKHQFQYHIGKKFFKSFQYDDFSDAALKVDLAFEKKSTMLELQFNIKGTVEVACDVTNELFNQKIEISFPLLVKFGNEYNDENDEILIIPHREFQLDVSQFIYEMIVLAAPIKRVHPGIEDGTLDSDVLKKLEEYKIEKYTSKDIDPRWNKLKDIVIDK